MVVLRRVIVPLVAIHIILATWSGYRAVVQVFSLDVLVPAAIVHDQSMVGFRATSSGRVWVTERVELIQGSHSETLIATRVPSTVNPSYNPRPVRATQSVPVSADFIDRFAAGPAPLPATAVGRPQWLRPPPPTVREMAITIVKGEK